ncbi:hypothetical protein TOPH_05384 [Tolypocladium ophioglossoides CBS 100239]|uniref:F-box domain-containing protein n=1 Tax=Tolypocladium ophioglossoides (strain CBS 100239) TaxID=1163406 RepID=A0A0L0N743_TOLOC|nr:hypothetical protein TOPH_05384 [Tolypocladium ophioglossoides CBS 100239]
MVRREPRPRAPHGDAPTRRLVEQHPPHSVAHGHGQVAGTEPGEDHEQMDLEGVQPLRRAQERLYRSRVRGLCRHGAAGQGGGVEGCCDVYREPLREVSDGCAWSDCVRLRAQSCVPAWEVGVVDSAASAPGDAVGFLAAGDEHHLPSKDHIEQHGHVGWEVLCGLFNGGSGGHGVRHYGRSTAVIEAAVCSGIQRELGQDLSRWFPLSSPSDFLYFLPARRGIDTAKKLRLISSAAGLGNPLDSLNDIVQGFSAILLGSSGTAVMSLVNTTQGQPSIQDMHSIISLPGQAPRTRSIDFFEGGISDASSFRKASAGSADHYRAVPLSDGYHILFTDPRTGNLCLGTDAPVGSLTRLLRKVWFRPPAGAASPVPILYAAGADTRHGVRVVATFSARGPARSSESKADEQVVVFYTVPPDLFHDMSRSAAIFQPLADQLDETGRRRVSPSWHLDETYRAIDIFSEPFQNSAVYPIEISGQPVATCSNLTEIALDSCPEMIIWAFSAEGWAKIWALDSGSFEPYTRTAVQRDGSVRRVDNDGDVTMADGDEDDDVPDVSSVLYQPLDGAAGHSPRDTETPRGCYFDRRCWRDGDRMSGTVSVDLVQELNGIVRLDVELR